MYVPIKRWPIGERAEVEEDEMWFEVAEEARKEILNTRLKKAINHKDTDLGLWKKGRGHTSRDIHYTIYK